MSECPICFLSYSREEQHVPRSMSCGHSFCHACLTKWSSAHAHRSRGRRLGEFELKCPTCSKLSDVPKAGFAINYALLETLDAKPKDTAFCSDHKELLTLLCKQCNVVICASCFCQSHQGHPVEHVKETFKTQMSTLRQRFATAEPRLVKQRTQILEKQKMLDAKCDESLADILSTETKIIDAIRTRAHQLKKNLTEQVAGKKRSFDAMLDRCNEGLSLLDDIHQDLMDESKVDVIAFIKSYDQRLSSLDSADVQLPQEEMPAKESKMNFNLQILADLGFASPAAFLDADCVKWHPVPWATSYEVQIATYLPHSRELEPYHTVYTGNALSYKLTSANNSRLREIRVLWQGPSPSSRCFSHVLTWDPASHLEMERGYLDLLRTAWYSSRRSEYGGFSSARSSQPLSFWVSDDGCAVASFSINVVQLEHGGEVMVGVCGSGLDFCERGQWVGRVDSVSYRSGSGIKIQDGRCADYGQPYEKGDTIRVEVNYKKRTITFFKNGVSQGVAFNNLDVSAPLYAAVSMNARGSVRLMD